MKNVKRGLALMLVLAMCMSVLAGCSLFPPKTAVDLVKRSSEVMQELGNNYRMNIDLEMGIVMSGSMEGLEMSMEIPVEAEMEFDLAGNNMHGEMDVSASVDAKVTFMEESETMNESMDESAEIYYILSEDGETATTYTNDGNGWVVSETDVEDSMEDLKAFMDAEAEDSIFANAEMTKDGDNYIVTVKFADAFKNKNFTDFLEDNIDADLFGEAEFDVDEFAEAIENNAITCTFDKQYRLVSVTTGEIEIDASDVIGDLDGMEMDEATITMEMSITLSKFGEVDADSVTVPDEIIDEAVESEDMGGISIDIGGDDEPETEGTEPPEGTVETDPSGGVAQSPVNSSDWVFMYEGTQLSLPTNYTVFVNDGWHAVDDGEYESFLCMENDKYEYLTLYLYTNDESGTEESVKTKGSDGFALSVDLEDPYPELSVAGISFGMSADTVKATLGEYNGMYSYDNYLSMEWNFEYEGKECTLTITCTDNKVDGIEVSYW